MDSNDISLDGREEQRFSVKIDSRDEPGYTTNLNIDKFGLNRDVIPLKTTENLVGFPVYLNLREAASRFKLKNKNEFLNLAIDGRLMLYISAPSHENYYESLHFSSLIEHLLKTSPFLLKLEGKHISEILDRGEVCVSVFHGGLFVDGNKVARLRPIYLRGHFWERDVFWTSGSSSDPKPILIKKDNLLIFVNDLYDYFKQSEVASPVKKPHGNTVRSDRRVAIIKAMYAEYSKVNEGRFRIHTKRVSEMISSLDVDLNKNKKTYIDLDLSVFELDNLSLDDFCYKHLHYDYIIKVVYGKAGSGL